MTAGTDTDTTIERTRGRGSAPGETVATAIGKGWRTITFGGFSSLTRRIVVLNLVALAALVVAILVLNQSRGSLIDAEVRSLTVQGELIANSIAAQAVTTPRGFVLMTPDEALDLDAAAAYIPETPIDGVRANQLIGYMATADGPRVRVYDRGGSRIVDSDRQEIFRAPLPPVGADEPSFLERLWTGIAAWFRRNDLPVYAELGAEEGLLYEEVASAVAGTRTTLTRVTEDGELVVSVAVPIRGYQTIQGAVLLTTRPGTIDDIIRGERNAILRVFAVAAILSVLLSLLLAGTIAAPLRRLAAAAERVRKGVRSRPQIPDFSKRDDEIGDLSVALRDMTTSLYNRIDAIESFAADVSHELKNPLTSLRSAVETLPLAKSADSQQRLTAIIQHDVRRLDRLISDISDASRLDAELARRDAEPLDLSKLMHALVALAGDAAKEGAAAIRLDVEEAEDDAYLVLGHDMRLSQVFNNLIDNARSFSPPGGVIDITVRRTDGEIEIAVEDRGRGIRAEQFERIFERFYTDRPEGESFGQNSGLGLSISKQIVEAHGGRIWAENVTGPDGKGGEPRVLGARFSVRLPAAAR